MRKQCKKMIAGLCAMILLAGVIFGDISVSASVAKVGLVNVFETWTGTGNTSTEIYKSDVSRFHKLVNSTTDEEIDPVYYTLRGNGEHTVIALKEEYLQTLPNGEYLFSCYFSTEGQEIPMFGDIAISSDPPGIELSSMSTSYPLSRLTYKGETVDPSYYTVRTDKGYPVILLKEGAPPAGDLVAYFSPDYLDQWVSLTVDRQALPSAAPADSAPPAVSSEEAATTVEATANGESDVPASDENLASVSSTGPVTSDAEASSTQTGSGGENDNTAVAVTVAAIAVAAVAGCAALGFVLLKRYRNKKKDK